MLIRAVRQSYSIARIMMRSYFSCWRMRPLGLEATHQKLKRDPTPSLERKMNTMLLQLQRDGQLPRSLYLMLRSSVGQTPHLYGLPKIHKLDTPLHPIVSFISSLTYIPSHFLARILSPLVGNYIISCLQFTGFC